MKTERIHITCDAVWRRPKARDGQPYVWGMPKSVRVEKAWAKPHLIYRWVRSSDHKTAVVGETQRPLGQRVNNYVAGRGSGKAGAKNKQVCREQQQLAAKGDSLYLEYLVELDGFDFRVKHERRTGEGLLIAFYRPYCTSEGA
jgi:hypothetical protein